MQHIKKLFELDTRAIALMRIFIAICVLWDLGIRATDIPMFYTDRGILPLHSLFQYRFSPYYFSFHSMNGHWLFQATLFALHFVFAIALLLGYKSRWATFFCLIFSISLNHRNPFILQGGDDYLQLATLWMLFLPSGNRYSVDSVLNKTLVEKPTNYSGMASAGLLMLIFSMYLFSALQKSSAEWHGQGTALYYALSLDQLTRPVGHWLYPHYDFLYYATRVAWYLEFCLPFLLFLPLKNQLNRGLFFILVLGFHCAIGLLLFVGLFPLICISVGIAALPYTWLDRLDRFILKRDSAFGFIRKNLKQFFHFLKTCVRINVFIKVHPTLRDIAYGAREPFLGFVILFSAIWNIGNVIPYPAQVTAFIKPIGQAMSLDQNWGMFAPGVFKDDGWLVYEGIAKNGAIMEIKGRNSLLSGEKPKEVLALFENDRWRKFTENYIALPYAPLRSHYCNSLFRNYNENHSGNRGLDTLKIYYVRERTLQEYKTAKPEKILTCSCYKRKKA